MKKIQAVKQLGQVRINIYSLNITIYRKLRIKKNLLIMF